MEQQHLTSPDLSAQQQQQQQQQQPQHSAIPCWPVASHNPSTITSSSGTSSRRRWLAVASLVLVGAAVLAVAVAVPTSAAVAAAAAGRAGAAAAALQDVDVEAEAAAAEGSSNSRMLQAQPACNGVPGLCKVPVRLVTFPGTHNSNAIKTNFASLAETQKLTFAEQLKAGARLFDIDYAGGRNGVKFGHCMSCLCAFSTDPSQNDPAQVFKAMADFLAANPRDVIVIGLSNIQCGDKAAARRELLGVLAASPLLRYIALQAIGPNTLLGDLVSSNQRAVFLFYDEWVTPSGYTIGGKAVPNQALWRIYGGGASVDGQDPATIDNQVSQTLLADVIKQLSGPQPALAPTTPWRLMGLFPSSCMVCRATDVCGPISCAAKANSESFVLFILGKATSRWTRSRGDQNQLVPAFNGFQIDYLQPNPSANVVSAAQKLNAAAAWMWNVQPAAAPRLGLGNCAWLLDDTAASGALACVADGPRKVSTLLGVPVASVAAAAGGRRRLQQQQPGGGSSKRLMLVPANPALRVRVFADGKLRKEVKGVAGQAQVLDLSITATDVAVSWAQ